MSKDYSLSMSGASARMPESMIAAQTYLELGDWNATRKAIIDANLFQLNAVSSRERIAGELVKRLRTLTDKEVEFFVNSYGDDRCAVLWCAICRTYPFVRDLSIQLVAGRYDRTIPDLTREAYEAFFEEQAVLHPELSALSRLGKDKIRNVIFRMLDECHLIDSNGRITLLHPTPAFKSALGPEHADDVLLFPGRVA
mgnify:CR=1 FL=1